MLPVPRRAALRCFLLFQHLMGSLGASVRLCLSGADSLSEPWGCGVVLLLLPASQTSRKCASNMGMCSDKSRKHPARAPAVQAGELLPVLHIHVSPNYALQHFLLAMDALVRCLENLEDSRSAVIVPEQARDISWKRKDVGYFLAWRFLL